MIVSPKVIRLGKLDTIYSALSANKLLPLFWLIQFLLALIPGAIFGWVLRRQNRKIWTTVVAAELLTLVLYAIWTNVTFPVPWAKQPPSPTWEIAVQRVIWLLGYVHMTRFVPALVAVQLGYFFGRRRISTQLNS